MKKFYLFFALLVVGFSAQAFSATENYRNGYGDAFIFVEGGVEFAVYPDGQFDFFYNPRRTGYNVDIVTPHINFSYNSGYNYDPYIQYDDFGAVIQIEDVPIYYDYYGRIIQAGHIHMTYNYFGMLSSVGHLFLHYNGHNHYTHYSGYINAHNPYYVNRPWHRYYVRPSAQFAIVFNQPYRAHYHPNRMEYAHYKNYYKKHYKSDFRKSYYRPGDRITSYHRGRRTSSPRDLRNSRSYQDKPVVNRTRSNHNSQRDRNVYQKHSQQSNTRNVTGPNARNMQVQNRRDNASSNRNHPQRRVNVSQRRQIERREAPVRTTTKRPTRQERRSSSARNEAGKEHTQARRPRHTKTSNSDARSTRTKASSSRNSRSSRGRGNKI